MAPLIHILALFTIALSTTVLASPHISRNVHNHVHRAIARSPVHVDSPLPKRKRSLSKRCLTPPGANSTSSAVPTTASLQPTSSAPINLAPSPSSKAAETTSSPPPTSSYVPPPPTSQASPTTTSTTSTTPPPPPPTSSTPPPAQTSSSSGNSGEPSFMTGTQSGQGTWYTTGLGACGITNNDSQRIVAVSESLFDAYPGYNKVNPNTNPVCGKTITASYGGKSTTVTVTDRCTGCSTTSLDFSPTAFLDLAAQSVGRIDITWDWD